MSTRVNVDAAETVVEVTLQLRHLCPFKDEVDYGEATIVWSVDGSTFELHALAEYLGSFRNMRISHEELTTRILRDLSPWAVSVTTRWNTAEMDVKVTRQAHRGDNTEAVSV